MDREQIVKSLECCTFYCDKEKCQYKTHDNPIACMTMKMIDALALINELIKENGELKHDILMTSLLMAEHREEESKEHQKQKRMLDEIYDGIVQLKANIVRKIKEDVAIYFGTYTDKDEVKVSDVIRLINRISEEILEAGDGNL